VLTKFDLPSIIQSSKSLVKRINVMHFINRHNFGLEKTECSVSQVTQQESCANYGSTENTTYDSF
jgi:hypothetical protein